MEVKEKKLLIQVLRDWVNLTADNRALAAILQEAQMSGEPVKDWLRNLDILRKSPEYRAIHEESSKLLDRIERAVEEKEILDLMDHLSHLGTVN